MTADSGRRVAGARLWAVGAGRRAVGSGRYIGPPPQAAAARVGGSDGVGGGLTERSGVETEWSDDRSAGDGEGLTDLGQYPLRLY